VRKATALGDVTGVIHAAGVSPSQASPSTIRAVDLYYQLAKRGNSLRVMAEPVTWGKRGARVNTISPGIIITPLAKDELTGPRGEGYRRMIDLCPTRRAGTPDEVAITIREGAMASEGLCDARGKGSPMSHIGTRRPLRDVLA
jgi:NAD(P)-dependent dehydrogenase (short-subunit alcohol dehydrogenase family)